jgi:hypothetical protein
MRDEAPRSVQQHISTQQVGAETLVYDELRHRAFCLNASSSVVWRLADGTRTVAEISAAASEELCASLSEELVRYAVEELRCDGLMEAAGSHGEEFIGPGMHVTERRAISRRAMLQRLGVGGALLLPVVASIVAPTAAQAYSGCVDCSIASPRGARPRRQKSSGLPAGEPGQ